MRGATVGVSATLAVTSFFYTFQCRPSAMRVKQLESTSWIIDLLQSKNMFEKIKKESANLPASSSPNTLVSFTHTSCTRFIEKCIAYGKVDDHSCRKSNKACCLPNHCCIFLFLNLAVLSITYSLKQGTPLYN